MRASPLWFFRPSVLVFISDIFAEEKGDSSCFHVSKGRREGNKSVESELEDALV